MGSGPMVFAKFSFLLFFAVKKMITKRTAIKTTKVHRIAKSFIMRLGSMNDLRKEKQPTKYPTIQQGDIIIKSKREESCTCAVKLPTVQMTTNCCKKRRIMIFIQFFVY